MLDKLRSLWMSIVVWSYQENKLWGHASRGDESGVWALLEEGMDPNFWSRGETPLMAAARHSYDSVVSILISRGADVNLSDSTGDTALFKAVKFGWRPGGRRDERATLSTIESLLIAGAAVNVEDNWGDAPLNWAIQGGKENEKLVELLLKHGAKASPLKFEDLIEPLMLVGQKAGSAPSQEVITKLLSTMSQSQIRALRQNSEVVAAMVEVALSKQKDGS